MSFILISLKPRGISNSSKLHKKICKTVFLSLVKKKRYKRLCEKELEITRIKSLIELFFNKIIGGSFFPPTYMTNIRLLSGFAVNSKMLIPSYVYRLRLVSRQRLTEQPLAERFLLQYQVVFCEIKTKIICKRLCFALFG